MQPSLQIMARLVFVGLATVGLTACGTMSKNIADDGTSVGQLNWESPDNVNSLRTGGTYPTLDSLTKMHAGMTKEQIQALVGPPHFGEGIDPREWNYVFNLPDGQGGYTVCEYKILFSTEGKAGSFYWNPESCAALVNPQPAAPQSFTLSADALFGFDSSSLKAQGQNRLRQFAQKVVNHEDAIKHITVVGYTDVLGASAYNQRLSEQRAESVAGYLVSQGVPGNLISARGMGESNPVKTGCLGHGSRAEQIACLAPNRRVEIKVAGVQPAS